MLNIVLATAEYEAWCASHTSLLPADVARKHEEMAEGSFKFFRATYYRWAQLFNAFCPAELRSAPRVLGVGDMHIDNFGTWRDAEGRLNWGVNDFDESAPIPYPCDLLRLIASALIAKTHTSIRVTALKVATEILQGYRTSLDAGGSGFVIAENHAWLRQLVEKGPRDVAGYWRKLLDLQAEGGVPKDVRKRLRALLPSATRDVRIVHRIAGLGGLGRARWTALGLLDESHVARELKARVPSAWWWSRSMMDRKGDDPLPKAWRSAIRSQDPFMRASKKWIVRRIGPDNSRIEVEDLLDRNIYLKLLSAMGSEVANVHCGSNAADRIRKNLRSVDPALYVSAAKTLAVHLQTDFDVWRRHMKNARGTNNPVHACEKS